MAFLVLLLKAYLYYRNMPSYSEFVLLCAPGPFQISVVGLGELWCGYSRWGTRYPTQPDRVSDQVIGYSCAAQQKLIRLLGSEFTTQLDMG